MEQVRTMPLVAFVLAIHVLLMVNAQEKSILNITDPVIDGFAFDLVCHVHSTVPSYVYWYTVGTSLEKIYSYHSGSGEGSTEDSFHFENRAVKANASLQEKVYRLHVAEAVKDIDTATYTCERLGEVMSDEVEVVVQMPEPETTVASGVPAKISSRSTHIVLLIVTCIMLLK